MREALKRRWLALRSWHWKADRPYRLIAFALLPLFTVAILERLLAADELGWLRDWVKGSAIYGPLFFPKAAPVEWKDRLQAILVLLGLPVAFCLWYWRDRNVRDQIEEQRKQVIEQQRQVGNQNRAFNLTEFQEVQMRAAGALDEKLPAEAREQLQIAALHQLRGFLRGEYGESFRRPAFELLLSGHAAMVQKTVPDKILINLLENHEKLSNYDKISPAIKNEKNKWTAVDRHRLNIIRDECSYLFCKEFSLVGRRFDWIYLHRNEFLGSLNLRNSIFIGTSAQGVKLAGADLSLTCFWHADLYKANFSRANLSSAYLQGALLIEAELVGANLTAAHLEGANLHLSRLVGANLTAAHLEGANLHLARLDGANLRAAHIEGADLSKAHLEGAWLIGVNLESANMEGAVFNDETVLSPDWLVMNSEKREEAQNKLRAMGARHVDDPPSGDAQGAVREGGADEVGAAGAV